MLLFVLPLVASRFVILRHRPTLLKLSCALFVFLGLILSLIPTITGMEKGSSANNEWLQQSRLGQILWPLCFMFGFVSLYSCLWIYYTVKNVSLL